MATSSKYVQVSSSVLMEYIYSDQTQINVPGNQFRIGTNTAPIWKMSNGHNKQDQIFNADSSAVVEDGLPIGTGNVRNKSFAIIEPYKTALLDIDKIVFYNDYDPLLTPTPNLPVIFNNEQAPVYDTVKLHLVQGFNFEENNALILSIKAKKKDGSTFILANIVYNREDTWETMNPSPFFFGGKIYNSYLEVRVLSLYNLIYDYWVGSLSGDTVVERITDFNGVLREQQISVYFSFANVESVIEDQTYLNLAGTRGIDIPVRDQFESISASINESIGGDYIEFYATYAGSIIDSYITDLNNSGYDFILLHDLVVSEYVFDFTTNSYSWIKSDDIQISQVSEYGIPNIYRPIVKNSGAISFKIDYTVRMFNRADNSQVWKSASMVSNAAAKYGKIIRSINLGANPVQTKIYNKKIVKDISINRITEPVINNTKYITSLSNNANISITTESINPGSTGSTSNTLVQGPNTLQGSSSGTSNLQVFNNGLARVLIPNATAFLKFTLFQSINGNVSTMNLSGLGDLVISFNSQTGEDVDFLEFPNPYTSKGTGEVVFRLSATETTTVLALTDRSFNIYLKNDAGDKTFLYTGKFYSTEEFQNLASTNKVSALEYQLTVLMSQISDLTNMINQQQDTISNITLEKNQFLLTVANLSTGATSASAQVDQKNALIQQQNLSIQNLQGQISTLNSQLSSLTNSLTLSMNSLANSNGTTNTGAATQMGPQTGTANNITSPGNVYNDPVTTFNLQQYAASIMNNPSSNMNPL